MNETMKNKIVFNMLWIYWIYKKLPINTCKIFEKLIYFITPKCICTWLTWRQSRYSSSLLLSFILSDFRIGISASWVLWKSLCRSLGHTIKTLLVENRMSNRDEVIWRKNIEIDVCTIFLLRNHFYRKTSPLFANLSQKSLHLSMPRIRLLQCPVLLHHRTMPNKMLM